MAEHLSQIQLTGYSGRTLDSDELLAVDRHLASCDVCHDRLARISSPVSGHHSTEEPFHLTYDEHLEAYVEGKSNDIDREIVESHIAYCSTCADELSDLKEFRRQPEYVPEHPVSPSKWKRWVDSWRQPVRTPQFSTALVFAILVLAITVAVLLWTTYRASRSVEQTRVTPSVNKNVEQPSPENRANGSDQPKEDREEPLIALNDGGGQVTMDQQGRVEGLGSLPPDLKQAVERTLATRRLQITKPLSDLSVPGELRDEVSEQNTFLPLAPVGAVIESDQPTFRWRKVEDGHVYSVAIYDSRLRNIENSGPLEGTTWTPSAPLKRGVTYTWQIRAVKDGTTIISPKPPAPEARFRVLDSATLATLGNVKRVHGKSHLAMGVFYWKHGDSLRD